MLFTAFSWIIIAIIFSGIGFACNKLIKNILGYEVRNLHGIVMLGMVFSTVYAETFSIIHKLGCMAFIILSIIVFLSLLYSGGEIYDFLCDVKRRMSADRIKTLSLFLIFVVFLTFASFVASRAPIGFDTSNYHAPDIRWLEEYGAVKGAGNIASRLAYNSSFHCLQALFSFAWIGGMSYHSMNGFIWLFMAMYAVCSLFFVTDRHFGVSDILRVLFLWILFGCISWGMNEPLSAPITDFLPVCLIQYIFIEWCSLNELGEIDEVPYGLLSILGVFATSVKLSAVVLVFLAGRPLIGLIRKRRYDTLTCFICMAFMVIVPFLARNIILSGYLLYPIAKLDLFDFDWEISKSVVVTDSASIKLYARNEGAYQYSNLRKSFFEWFVEWQKIHYAWHAMYVMCDLILAPLIIVIRLYMYIKKRHVYYDHIIYIDAALGFLVWLFSAPLLRFGIGWIYILPVIFIYCIVDMMDTDKAFDEKYENLWSKLKNYRSFIVMLIVVFLMCFVNMQRMLLWEDFDARIIPKDYDHTVDDERTYEISGYKFYYSSSLKDPEEGLLIGYDGFPGALKLEMIKRIELRGNSLADGFRVKKEYKNIPCDSHGRELNAEEIAILDLERYYK